MKKVLPQQMVSKSKWQVNGRQTQVMESKWRARSGKRRAYSSKWRVCSRKWKENGELVLANGEPVLANGSRFCVMQNFCSKERQTRFAATIRRIRINNLIGSRWANRVKQVNWSDGTGRSSADNSQRTVKLTEDEVRIAKRIRADR